MTVKELYEYCKELKIEDYPIFVEIILAGMIIILLKNILKKRMLIMKKEQLMVKIYLQIL